MYAGPLPLRPLTGRAASLSRRTLGALTALIAAEAVAPPPNPCADAGRRLPSARRG
jgi:hypothetical protein